MNIFDGTIGEIFSLRQILNSLTQDTLEVTGQVAQKVIASSFIMLLLGSSASYLVR